MSVCLSARPACFIAFLTFHLLLSKQKSIKFIPKNSYVNVYTLFLFNFDFNLPRAFTFNLQKFLIYIL